MHVIYTHVYMCTCINTHEDRWTHRHTSARIHTPTTPLLHRSHRHTRHASTRIDMHSTPLLAHTCTCVYTHAHAHARTCTRMHGTHDMHPPAHTAQSVSHHQCVTSCTPSLSLYIEKQSPPTTNQSPPT